MARASILLLLACGGILTEGRRMSNANSNSNSNIIGRRNSNANSNSNVIGRYSPPSLSPYRGDINDEQPIITLDALRRRFFDKELQETDAAVGDAAETAISITKSLVQEFTDTVAAAVAESVSQILRRNGARVALSRRNYNTNSNTNIIGPKDNRDHLQVANSVGQGIDPPGGVSPPGYAYRAGKIYHDRGTGGTYRDPAEEEEEEEKEVTTEIQPLEIEADDVEEEKQASASKSFFGSGWGSVMDFSPEENHNTNTNDNRINYRRNSNRMMNRLRDDSNEYEPIAAPSRSRINSNSNVNNNVNSFRRNMHSRWINDSFRRNTNSNTNNNRINRGNRYHRD